MNRAGWMAVAAGIGMVAGMRSMTAPAVVSGVMARTPRPLPGGLSEALLSSRRSASLLAVLALGELLLDKARSTPDRTRGPLLASRATTGAVAAAALASRHSQPVLRHAWIGALAAVIAAYGFLALRKGSAGRLRIPDRVVGLVEDLLALGSAFGLVRKL